MCLAQGHNAVTLVRFEPLAHRSRAKHSPNESMRSLCVIEWNSIFSTCDFDTYNPCVDPEVFVRVGPTLKTSF